MKFSLFVLGSILLSTVLSLPVKRGIFGPRCHKLESDFCKDVQDFPANIQVNTTVSISDRSIIEHDILNNFIPLINSGCSAHLKEYLCFAYYPLCVQSDEYTNLEISPCRKSCKAIREKCELYVVAAGQTWPESLDCDNLSDDLCMPIPAVPQSSPPTVTKCEECQVETKPSNVAEEICNKDSDKIFVKARVLTKQVTGDTKNLAYNVQIEQVLKSRTSDSVKSQETTWIITSSTEDCDCHQLEEHESYLLGLEEHSTKNLYVLTNDAVVTRWRDVKDIGKKVDECKDA